ncbi:aldo/keto reductase [Desulfobacterota bacterium AH_259_B03_O07]|nr:aldo/keto reductase [Desulfobacterota bacterium AH_259_B03_O07]
MELKPLGNTDVMVPEIGLGTWSYNGGVAPLKRGIELGATLIDTAEGYYTEDIVGKAIKGIRDRVFIATKVSGRHLDYDGVLRAAEGSLMQLETDYIDLYLIHWPNPHFPIKDTMRALEKLADNGVMKYIGVSNFSVEEMMEAQSYLRNYQIVSNQVLYNLNSREIEYDLLPYCQENKITIMAYTPLDNGNLASGSHFLKRRKLNVLDEIAKETKKTMAQVALNWCTSHSYVIAIPKSDNVKRTTENCQASGWRLSKEQINRLNEAF